MEVINVAESVVVQIEVIAIVEYVVLAVATGHGSVIEVGLLDGSHAGVEVVVALRGEEKVVVRVGLELEVLVVGDKGVQEEAHSEQRDYEQSQVDTFVEVDVFEFLFFGES